MDGRLQWKHIPHVEGNSNSSPCQSATVEFSNVATLRRRKSRMETLRGPGEFRSHCIPLDPWDVDTQQWIAQLPIQKYESAVEKREHDHNTDEANRSCGTT